MPGRLDYVDPSAPKGGIVKLGARGTFDSLHPFIVKSVPAAGITSIWDTLCWSSRDEASTEYGLIAETMEWPDDRSWVAFTLRPQARFHDGTPITVEDVIFTFDILKAKGAPNYAFYYHDVLKAEKIGDRKVLFTFRDNTNKELPLIVGQLPVLPSKWWATRDFEKVSLEIPLGSGPYKVESFDVGRSIADRRMEDWWAKDLWMNRGRNNFERHPLRVLSRRHRAVRGLQGGRDRHPPGEHRAQLGHRLRHPAVHDGRIQRPSSRTSCRPACSASPSTSAATSSRTAACARRSPRCSTSHGPTRLFVRDVPASTSTFLAIRSSPRPACRRKEELEVLEPLRGQIPEEVFTQEFKLPVTDGTGNIREGARRAIALLKEAGWEIKDGKMTSKATGQAVQLRDAAGRAADGAFCAALQAMGGKGRHRGARAHRRPGPVPEPHGRLRLRPDDRAASRQSLSPGNEQREFWGSEVARTKGSRNTGGIADPAIDKLIELVISAPDRKSLIMRTRALDRVLLWHHYRRATILFDRVLDRLLEQVRPSGEARQIPAARPLAWWIDVEKEKALRSLTGGKQ